MSDVYRPLWTSRTSPPNYEGLFLHFEIKIQILVFSPHRILKIANKVIQVKLQRLEVSFHGTA